ncbi:MarR family winged helix-turn-helix transcriptional regulator [Azospirillum sp. ST 5-10]|uniref:MarR family winged helix-turn-helix transcriptional regulator n=1 Tax=unclassified Azospirillum TaxID=2630922 RepID=UPI003F4A7286
MTGRTAETGEAAVPFALERYWPYRLHVLATAVSQTVAKVYADRFAVTIPEWRIIAVLGGLDEGRTLSATAVATLTAMDRVQVSRAMARMLDTGLIVRATGRQDRRTAQVSLTAKGRGIYQRIVPLARAFEDRLLTVLAAEECAELDRLVAKLEDRAGALAALPKERIAALIDPE